MHKFKEGDLWLLTSTFDQRLTEISVIVGIIGAILSLPIFKSIGNWFRQRRKRKDEHLIKTIEQATQPLIDFYKREHQVLVDKVKLQDEASISVLHDRVYQEGMRLLHQGWATVDDIDNYIHLYDPYHNLGGNGTGEAIYRRVMDLPIKQQQETLVDEAVQMHKERDENN